MLAAVSRRRLLVGVLDYVAVTSVAYSDASVPQYKSESNCTFMCKHVKSPVCKVSANTFLTTSAFA